MIKHGAWYIVRMSELSLPDYIEGLARGWIEKDVLLDDDQVWVYMDEWTKMRKRVNEQVPAKHG